MSLQGENEQVVATGLGAKLHESALSKDSVVSPLDNVVTTNDLTDVGSEESNSRVRPLDSAEDFVDQVQAVVQSGETQLKKKKSIVRSFKKGASKRYKALARKSKEMSEALNRSLSGRLSLSRSQISETASEVEDYGSEEDAPNSENSDYKQQVDEDMQQDEAATKIARGPLARLESFRLEEDQLEVQDRAEIIASDLEKFRQSVLDEDFSLLTVSKQTEVYCGELIRLGQSQQEQTVLKLIAHIYAIMLSTLTQGVRIGSVVAQKLSLVQIDAIDMYRKWPQTQDDPMKAICGFIDHVGDQINDDQKEVIYNEIGRAFLEASRIMQHLAKEK
eukprot:TRINITY_DN2095_c0_g1_i1.p1 TRINITY_DN2095_c0_g1~~TRINITY_DN2095_c0_g1_i1.p1  ORF type:complete len:333 (-),score=60.30 TRINITY_DN2095_c0_g1_i1:112-1110(-)